MATKTKTKATVTEAPKTKIEKFSQTLKVNLTQTEMLQRGARSADIVAKLCEKDADMKAAQKHAKAEIEALEAELSLLSNEVRTKSTHRSVECENHYIYENGVLEKIRTDTGEVIESRKLTEREMQLDLDFEPHKNGKTQIDDDKWKPVPVAEAFQGLDKRTYGAFEKAGIATMGDFAAFQEKHGEFWVKDLDGVGPEAAGKIADASESFWKKIMNQD